MRVLIVHNQLWAHYKSRLFSEIYRSLGERFPESEMLVLQIALYESSRAGMQDDTIQYKYPYKVLFRKSLDEVGLREKTAALFKAFDAFRPTVLNITGYFDPAQVALLFYAKMKGVKVVISSESSSADHSRKLWKEAVKKWIVGKADAFFCFGKSSARYLLELGAVETKIAVRNAAVIDESLVRSNYDEALQSIEKTASRFVYVGRLAPEKNISLLINAFVKTARLSSWELWLIGEGPVRQELEAQAAASGLSDRIRFLGGHPWHRVPGLLASCDVLVLPSISEPWGLVVNEAMTCGMPVIVSKNCGCAEDLVENGANGFTFDPENAAELGTALDFFIKNPEKMIEMGQSSLRLIAPFSSTEVADDMVSCYGRL